MKNHRFSKKRQRSPEKNFSSNLCLAILGILFVVKDAEKATKTAFQNCMEMESRIQVKNIV
jgi:hypothetical protein